MDVIVSDAIGFDVPKVLVYDIRVIKEHGCPTYCDSKYCYGWATCQANIKKGEMRCETLLKALVRRGIFPGIINRDDVNHQKTNAGGKGEKKKVKQRSQRAS